MSAWLLLAASMIRTYSLLMSCVWLYSRGEESDAEFRRLSPGDKPKPEKVWDAYGRTGGQFLPFGVKSWRLKMAAVRRSGLCSLAFKALRIMWLYWLLGPVLVAGLLWTSRQSASTSGGAWLYMGSALLLAVGSSSLTAEGAIARGSGISWSGTHHRWPVVTSKSRLAHPNQDLALVGATGVLVVLPTMVALYVVSGSRFEAFAD